MKSFIPALNGRTISRIAILFTLFMVEKYSWAQESDQSPVWINNNNLTYNLADLDGSENKYLSHSFVESPDMMNVYNGLTELDYAGRAWVPLPE